jgi:predicted RNA-binding Zn-ribbon protein involved in translation (DUF1610 family)
MKLNWPDMTFPPINLFNFPQFVCTVCRLRFTSIDEHGMKAKCPECGETYGHFFTKLVRCGTFDMAYWLRDEPGEIRKHKSCV